MEIKQVLVTDNRYMNDNVIKYAYENNIRPLYLIKHKAANLNLNKETPFAKANFIYEWKTAPFICPMNEHPH